MLPLGGAVSGADQAVEKMLEMYRLLNLRSFTPGLPTQPLSFVMTAKEWRPRTGEKGAQS